MKGTVLYGSGDIRFEEVPEPKINKPTDAIIRIAATCVCGSDLWPYRGIAPGAGPTRMGHEYCGYVEEVGNAVTSVKPGQFAIGSFATSDNTCPTCSIGYQSSCMRREFVTEAQSPYLRVPNADGTLVATPDAPDAAILPGLLATSDVLGTGWYAADAAKVKPGATAVVVGDGAVGLLATLSAKYMGAGRIIVMSRNPARQKLACGFVLAILGFFVIAALDALKVKGSILIGILGLTVIAVLTGLAPFGGIMSTPPSIAPTFFQFDVFGALGVGIVQVVLVFVLVEVFDATGTLIGVAKRAGLLNEGPGETSPALGRALMADSSAIVAGSMLGTSSTTAYVESASGVQAGGRTGLTALTVGVLFLAALFFAPLAGTVPAFATAPALLYVACLMMRELVDIDWDDITESAPAALTAIMMPFTYSIANGLAFGFISYALIKLMTGRASQVHPATWLVAGLFMIRFAFLSH